MGRSGTIVYMPQCDRLTYVKANTLVDHAVKEMARVYRRAIGAGLELFVNNRRVEAVDPTYSMANARHTRVEDLPVKLSRLIVSKPVQVKIAEKGTETAPITIKLYRLPIEVWKQAVDSCFPGTAWLRVRRDVFDRLTAYRTARMLPTWESVLDELLERGE